MPIDLRSRAGCRGRGRERGLARAAHGWRRTATVIEAVLEEEMTRPSHPGSGVQRPSRDRPRSCSPTPLAGFRSRSRLIAPAARADASSGSAGGCRMWTRRETAGSGGDQGVREDLPRQRGLRDEAEDEVLPLPKA